MACRAYPFFSFVVPKLRRLRKDRGEEFPVGNVRFAHGILDTLVQGYDEDEAALILEVLQGMRDRPAWGIDIYEAGQQAIGVVADGRYPCPVCAQRYDSVEGLRLHLPNHERHAEVKPGQEGFRKLGKRPDDGAA